MGEQNYFNALGSVTGAGMQGLQGLGQYGGSTIGGMGGTLSGLASGALGEAAGQTQKGTGVMSLLGGLFSDVRLKDNIKFTGNYSPKGYEIYTWTWNDAAEKLGLSGDSEGVIADKVEMVDPDAITLDESGYKKVNYERV